MTSHWVITGLMGAGKTTVGRRLAEAARRPFIDNDVQLLARTGRTAKQIQETDGVDALHRAEREAFAAALESPTPSVIAAAASVVEDKCIRGLMRGAAHVVWLRAPVDVLGTRVARQPHRPLGDDASQRLAAQAEARSVHFADVADTIVDATRAPDDIVRELLDVL